MSREVMRFEAQKTEEAAFEKSMKDYREAGYESPVTEWERNFWEAGFRRGIAAGLDAADVEIRRHER